MREAQFTAKLLGRTPKEEAKNYLRELKELTKWLSECLKDADNDEATIDCVEEAQQAIEDLNRAWRSLRFADEALNDLVAELRGA